MVNVTVNDERAPVEQVEPTFQERFPRGSFIAYNGTVEDGQRRRAVIVDHGDDESLVLQDGTERVVLTGDEITSVVILAASADAFAQRVSNKAKALGREHNWCSVAERAIEVLNSQPEPTEHTRSTLRVEMELNAVLELLPTRDMVRVMHEGTEDPDAKMLRFLKEGFNIYWSDLINSGYFRLQNNPNDDAEVTLSIAEVPEETSTTEA